MRFAILVAATTFLAGFAGSAFAQDKRVNVGKVAVALEQYERSGRMRELMQRFPKGGDLHNHLTGAIYAESWLDWAAEDGLCVETSIPALRQKPDGKSCVDAGLITAEAARADAGIRQRVIDSLSNRSYVPTLDWSGHDDFFVTFFRMASAPHRFGDQLAEVAERAGHQNTLYLELLETIVLGELFGSTAGVTLIGDVEADYAALMASPFGAQIPTLVATVRQRIADAQAKKSHLLGCDVDASAVGCDVKIRFLHQVIREFPPQMVYAQIILGWAVMDQVPEVVGINLVAPEDGFIALRDYTYHMKMIDHLYRNHGEQNVTLHAGELTLGLVRPRQLRFHIREAIELGHAKRIGHGIDITFEDDSAALAKRMADEGIMVEISLTSNDTILGVSGRDHPINFYRELNVPYAIGTDDEGVSRSDLTHEYMRYFRDYDITYSELRYASRNSLTYSFLPGTSIWEDASCRDLIASGGILAGSCQSFVAASEKAQLQWELEQRLQTFERELRAPGAKLRFYDY